MTELAGRGLETVTGTGDRTDPVRPADNFELPEQEICPSCGGLFYELDDVTGWCPECAGVTTVSCLSCGEGFAKDAAHRKLCPKCRDERWLARNADAMEVLLRHGYSIGNARQQVYEHNRPHCLSCGAVLVGARNGAQFCTKTQECRSWRRRYRTLKENYQRKGLQQAAKQAIAQVSAEIWLFKEE